MDGSALEKKSSFKVLGLVEVPTLSLMLKLPRRKLEQWLVLWISFSRGCCVSINLPYVHVWNMHGICIRICKTAGPSLAASLEPLAHHQNVASLSIFCRNYFGKCSSELAQLVLLSFSQGRSTHYSDWWHEFCVTIPRCYKDVKSFFSPTPRLRNSLPAECFPLTYDLSGFKPTINRHLLTVGCF